ncbi:MAG: HAMP domain-containing sensor histidine kinase [Cyanobacteria bacterium J06581_3]
MDMRYHIDELITIPVDPIQLEMRLAVLLRTRHLSESLHRKNQQLEEANALKLRFVSVVSHEFRSPLSVISSLAQLLQQRGERLSLEKKQDMFERMQAVVGKLTRLLDDLLLFSRNASAKASFNPQKCNLSRHCQKIVSNLELSTQGARTIDFYSEGELAEVTVNTALIDTIVTNLLSNALKYSPIGSKVSLKLCAQAHQLILEVVDEGRGIPLDDQADLFEAFFRASNVGTTSGTGLGLSIVKQCVNLHRGAIAVNSTVEQGTSFMVTLPIGEGVSYESQVTNEKGPIKKGR